MGEGVDGITVLEYSMKAMLDPKRDLKGATPETLARALLRRVVPYSRPRAARKPVVRDQVPVEKIPAD